MRYAWKIPLLHWKSSLHTFLKMSRWLRRHLRSAGPLWKSTWAEAGERRLATDVVADHFRAAHYSTRRWSFFFFCCRWWHNPPNPVCLHIDSFAIITGWLFSTVHYVPSTNSIPQGNAVFSQLHGLCNKPYWRRFMEKINSAIAAP